MSLRTEETPNSINVYFRGVHELDRDQMISICEYAKSCGKSMVADLEDAKFLNSLVIGAVVLMHQEARKRQGVLRVIRVSPDVLKVFKISRLDKILDLQQSDEDPEAQ